MTKVLVIFGSSSDRPVYEKISKSLEEAGADHEVKVCSAHRSPDLLLEILEEYPDSPVIAGAGLAAHLPGVVASKSVRPVIGVPCDGNYQGLDALLSIVQMPPGIPVLGVGVGGGELAVSAALLMLKGFEKVNLMGDKENKRVKSAADMLEKFKVSYGFSDSLNEKEINIRFVDFGNNPEKSDALVINVPLLDGSSAEDALKTLSFTKNGLWVGLNRGDNAAMAAIEIIALLSERHKNKLDEYRKEMESKVRKTKPF